MATLPIEDIESYRERGYLVVHEVIGPDLLDELRRSADELVDRAAEKPDPVIHDVGEVDGKPYVRRLKSPHRHHPFFAELVRDAGVLDIVEDLVGGDIRLYGTKLNLKPPSGAGDAIEWHQDWAFYPHTNDDLVAVGILLDDMTEDNGPLLVVPGSHRGPVYSHLSDEGYFCGALDFRRLRRSLEAADVLTAPAGSITLHHVRAVHGSGPNRSGRPRRVLFENYAAADAWPLVGCGAPGDRKMCAGGEYERYRGLLVRGTDRHPRLSPVPVRLPLPSSKDTSSVYTTQQASGRSYFAGEGEVA
ncbi:MAG TPA: phytanoyl-CoA dioxygenase family protein [Acidimicrobiales bacterium]